MEERFGWRRQVATAVRFPAVRLAGYPTLVNLSVTHRCNAKCDFCNYWPTRDEERLDDFVPLVRRLKPVVLMLCGGEPLLRSDLESIVSRLRRSFATVYIGVITNGSLLTVQRGLALWRSGLDQLAVSLDFLDDRHDRARGIPGLARRITETIPRLVAEGIDGIVLNTVIKADNLDSVLDIVRWAQSQRVKVSLSTFTAAKTDAVAHNVATGDLPRLRELIAQLLALKRGSNTITSSTWYLERIPRYFEGGISGCMAGRRFVEVTPAGIVLPCDNLGAAAPSCHYSEWTPRALRPPENCVACWCSCRGESEAPLDWERVKQAVTAFHGRKEMPVRPEG